MKLLFLLKKNNSYGYGNSPKAGLFNSATMTARELEELGVDTRLRVVVDGNSIDREIHLYRPNYVILEAIWVTPDKIRELVRLHPRVNFIVRVHSEVPFLSNEGVSVSWLKEYSYIPHTCVAFNSQETLYDFLSVSSGCYDYLPNIYESHVNRLCHDNRSIDIGSFGAIRPLKNQLIQGFAAIAYGNEIREKVNFHINSSRVEQGGESTLKNLRALFKNTHHKLIEHSWMDREGFLSLVSRMDLGLQLSFSESFNIVTGDFISQGVPIIVSKTISWMPDDSKVPEDSLKDIVSKMKEVDENRIYYSITQSVALALYNRSAKRAWKEYLNI